MKTFALYLESGPRRRTTMAHVLELLGCTAHGPTTEEALEAAPEAIRLYLRFLELHGEAIDSQEPFTTLVVEHVMEGPWLGYGDPAPGFGPDFEPLTAGDLAIYLRRLDGLHADILRMVGALSQQDLTAEPQSGGRPIARILEHLAESESAYLRYQVGKVEGLSEALKDVQRGPEGIVETLPRVWRLIQARLEGLSEVERQQQVPHGQVTWTARRALRRMLEHGWEHRQEIARRLGEQPG